MIDLERAFEVMRCLNEDQVHLATFLLKKKAFYGWEIVRSGYVDPTAITWVEFQLIFFIAILSSFLLGCEMSQVFKVESRDNVYIGV